MRFLLLFVLSLSLYAQTDSCHTIQLITKYNTEKNKNNLHEQDFPNTCKIMDLDKFLTVRCECLDTNREALEKLPLYNKDYKSAVITKTARHRFLDKQEKEEEKKIIKKEKIKSQPEACYSVQLLTKHNTKNNFKELNSNNYPDSCKIMNIGRYLTVRCGCYDEKYKVKKELSFLKQNYSESAIVRTAKYRFDENNVKEKAIKPTNRPKKVFITNPVVVTPPVPIILDEEVKKTMPAQKKAEVIDILEAPKIVRKPVQILKKKKEDRKKEINTSKTSSEKVTKKKEKYKYKYVKKRDMNNFYDRDLAKYRDDSGIAPYDYRYRFGAQASYDFGHVREFQKSYTDYNLRRLRIYHKGSFFKKKLFYELEYGFLGDNNIKDMYIGYKGNIKPLKMKYRVKFGNLKVPFSLEKYSSSKYSTFMERSLNDAFLDSRKFGAEFYLSKKITKGYLNFFTSYYKGSINDRINDEEIDTPVVSSRITYAKKLGKKHLFSIGGGYASQDIEGKNIKFSQRGESKFIKEKYVSEKIKDVDYIHKSNFEFLYINSKYSFQAEYTDISLKNDNDSYQYNGYYLQGSYFFLGRGREYNVEKSTLEKIKPNRDGAIELAFRYSSISLNDEGKNGVKTESGGSQKDYTYGVNWYYNKELKFMFNYVAAYPKDTTDYDGLIQVYQLRALFAF